MSRVWNLISSPPQWVLTVLDYLLRRRPLHRVLAVLIVSSGLAVFTAGPFWFDPALQAVNHATGWTLEAAPPHPSWGFALVVVALIYALLAERLPPLNGHGTRQYPANDTMCEIVRREFNSVGGSKVFIAIMRRMELQRHSLQAAFTASGGLLLALQSEAGAVEALRRELPAKVTRAHQDLETALHKFLKEAANVIETNDTIDWHRSGIVNAAQGVAKTATTLITLINLEDSDYGVI